MRRILSITTVCVIIASHFNLTNAAENDGFSHLSTDNYRTSSGDISSPLKKSYRSKTADKKYVISTKPENQVNKIQQNKPTFSSSSHSSSFNNVDAVISITPSAASYQGYYKIGKPYKIEGITYYPQEYDSYEEIGESSWYGKDFDGKLTANGEIYNMNDFTAAHRTLPMPSIVRVTNLDNQKSIVVRVNDRGPFSRKRVIDLSKAAATELGFKHKGLTHVKIELLKKESDQLLVDLNLKND